MRYEQVKLLVSNSTTEREVMEVTPGVGSGLGYFWVFRPKPKTTGPKPRRIKPPLGHVIESVHIQMSLIPGLSFEGFQTQ